MTHSMTTGAKALLRADRRLVRRHLSYAPATLVSQGEITSLGYDAINGNLYSVTVDSVTGDPTDALAGMTVWFGTTPGARNKGAVRLRKDGVGTLSLATFYVAETSPAQLNLEVGDYATVVALRQPWSKIPRLVEIVGPSGYVEDFIEFHDYDQIYTNQNYALRPLINVTTSGLIPVRHAGYLDPGETYRTVYLDSSTSDPVGGTIASRLWLVDSGTTIVGGDDTATEVELRLSEGFHWVGLFILTDRGGFGIRWLPLWAHGDSYRPVDDFRVEDHTREEWAEMTLTLGSDADVDGIKPGSTLCYWEEALYEDPDTGELVDAPSQRVREVLGWAPKGTLQLKAYEEAWELRLVGLGGWLSSMQGFGQLLLKPVYTDATKWHEMVDVTVNRAAHYVLREYSNALELANCYLSGNTDAVEEEEIKPATQWEQVKFLIGGYFGAIGCDSTSGIWIRKQIFYAQDSGDFDTILSLDPHDWTHANGLELPQELEYRVAKVNLSGSHYDGIPDALGVKSHILMSSGPGDAPAAFGQQTEGPFQRLPTDATEAQEELNWRVGAEWFRQNNQFPEVSIELLGDLDAVEPAWRQIVKLTYPLETPSGIEITDQEFVVTRVSIQHDDDGQRRVTWELEGRTYGRAGTTVPVDEVDPPFDWEPPDTGNPDDDGEPFPPYTGDLVPFEMIVWDSGGAGCYYCTQADAETGSPLWIDADSAGLTGYTVWASADPYNYGRYFALQSTGLYRNDGPFNGGTWSLVADNDDIYGDSGRLGGDLVMSINRRGYILIPCGHNVCISYDYGETWSRHKVFNDDQDIEDLFATDLSVDYVKVAVSPYNNPGASGEGWVYAGSREGGYGFHFSDDWGETWESRSNSSMVNGSPHPHVAYIRRDGSTPNVNDDDQEVHWQAWGGGNETLIRVGTFQSSVLETLEYVASANLPAAGSAIAGRPMSSFTWDGRKYATSYAFTGAGGGSGLLHYLDDDSRVVDTSAYGSGIWTSVADRCSGWTNRFSNHSEAILWGHRLKQELVATLDEGSTFLIIPLPSSFTGAAYGEWSLRLLIPPEPEE